MILTMLGVFFYIINWFDFFCTRASELPTGSLSIIKLLDNEYSFSWPRMLARFERTPPPRDWDLWVGTDPAGLHEVWLVRGWTRNSSLGKPSVCYVLPGLWISLASGGLYKTVSLYLWNEKGMYIHVLVSVKMKQNYLWNEKNRYMYIKKNKLT